MAFIPETFPTPPPIASASFDYFDIAEGTGIKSFFLANTELSGSVTTSVLTQNTLYSDDTEVSGSKTTGLDSDLDYDLTSFNLPQNIKGTAYVNIPHIVESSGGSQSGYLKVKLRKWDGTTETEIASAISKTVTGTAGVSAGKVIHHIPLPITTVKHFKKGETLRLTVEVWNLDAGGTYAYGIDPKDRASSYLVKIQGLATTTSTVYIPFILKTS